VYLSKDNSGQTPWHKEAGNGKVEILGNYGIVLKSYS